MGHRATYAIRENGNIELFYSHWGALSVPQDIFWGPESAEDFIRANEPADEWLDDVWGEGGVGLDKDQKIVSWYGGEVLAYEPYCEIFGELVAALWGEHGWKVRQVDGMPDIAEALGEDRGVATAEYLPPYPTALGELGKQWEKDGSCWALLSVRGEGTRHYALDTNVDGFIAAGPEVLDHLGNLPTLAEALERYENRELEDWEEEAGRKAPLTNQISSGVFVDREAREVRYFGAWARTSSDDVAHFHAIWPGWTVLPHTDGMEGHFASCGEAAPDALLAKQWWGGEEPEDDEGPEPAEDELLGEIAEMLLGERRDPSEFMAQVIEAMEEEGHEDVWINPHARVTPPDERPEPTQAEAIFGRAVAAMMRNRQRRD